MISHELGLRDFQFLLFTSSEIFILDMILLILRIFLQNFSWKRCHESQGLSPKINLFINLIVFSFDFEPKFNSSIKMKYSKSFKKQSKNKT